MAFSFSDFWSKNKVFILGSIAAAIVVIQQYSTGAANPLVVGFAIAAAIGSYLGKSLTGQIGAIITLVGSLAGLVVTQATAGAVNWKQIAISAAASIVGILTEFGSKGVKLASKIQK